MHIGIGGRAKVFRARDVDRPELVLVTDHNRVQGTGHRSTTDIGTVNAVIVVQHDDPVHAFTEFIEEPDHRVSELLIHVHRLDCFRVFTVFTMIDPRIMLGVFW